MRTPFILDLPKPPSANMIWRKGKRGQIYLAPKYTAWKATADGLLQASGQNRGRKPIEGRFTAKIYIREGTRGDLDNFAKPLLDWAQRAGIVADDKHMRQLTISYGDISNDCRLVVEAL